LTRLTDELRFTYQGVKQLTRPMGKPKFKYQGINSPIRPTDKPKVEGIKIISWRAQAPQREHKAQ
jgi:hypothetical protein